MSSIRKAKQIFAAALEAAKPEKAMRRFVRPSLAHEFPRLYIDDRKYDMRNFDKVMVVGAGKATVNMLTGLLQVYPTTRESSKDELTAASSFPPIYGKIITKYDHYSEQARKLINISMQRQRECFDMTSSADAVSDLKMEVDEAGHPIPDECGLSSTREILHMANLADARTLVITLISGGGSSLLVSPVESVSLQELVKTNQLLMECGADIQEINAVRKCISQVKGGKFASIAYPAIVETLVLSDIIGDPLDDIASGPTVMCSRMDLHAKAKSVMQKYKLEQSLPESVIDCIKSDRSTSQDENPTVYHTLVGSNTLAMDAAAQEATQLGMNVAQLTSQLQGNAEESGRFLVSIASEAANGSGLTKSFGKVGDNTKDLCILSGGETTMNLTSQHGLGGRNQHMALSSAIKLYKERSGFIYPVTFMAAGTDGTDGPTDAAGAVVSSCFLNDSSIASSEDHLARCDSYNFFKLLDEQQHYSHDVASWVSSLCSLVKTGPTGTNVMDLQIIIINCSDN